MNDGDTIHEWVDDKGNRFRVESLTEWHLRVVHWAGKKNPSWRSIEWFNRSTAEQLLVAFDKMEVEQNKQHGPLSVELAGLPGRYLPGLDGQPVRVDDATDKMEGRG